MEKFRLKFKLTGMPGVGDVQMFAGECQAETPRDAGKKLEPVLQSRIGLSKYKYLSEAVIVDSADKERATLLISKTEYGHYGPRWGTWLTIYDKA